MEHSENELALLRRMGVPSFRHVTKDLLVDLVDGLPTLDPEVALQVLAQVPHLAKIASEVLADNAGAHQDTLQANAHGGDQLHELRLARQRALIELMAREGVRTRCCCARCPTWPISKTVPARTTLPTSGGCRSSLRRG